MIPIIYCGNDKIFKGIFLSALSVARRSKEALKVYVLTMNYTDGNPSFTSVCDEKIKVLDDALKQFNSDSLAVKVDLTEEFKRYFAGGKNCKTNYTPYALLRLLADKKEVIAEDKAIYLDVDTMACADINILYGIDVENYEYGAALDYMGKFWVAKDYCNSGVLLLNLKKIRETGLFEKCREKVYKNRYFMPDQTALHRSATARLYLDGRFNEQRDIKPDTVIKHFNKGINWLPFFKIYNIKQWEVDKVHSVFNIHDFDEDYEFYSSTMDKNGLEKEL